MTPNELRDASARAAIQAAMAARQAEGQTFRDGAEDRVFEICSKIRFGNLDRDIAAALDAERSTGE